MSNRLGRNPSPSRRVSNCGGPIDAHQSLNEHADDTGRQHNNVTRARRLGESIVPNRGKQGLQSPSDLSADEVRSYSLDMLRQVVRLAERVGDNVLSSALTRALLEIEGDKMQRRRQ